jgi:molybdopterin-guanine dinucleotide biosynthesis protein A
MRDAHDAEHVVGVVLAGGRGRRLGGDKAIVELDGRPLIQYALEVLHEVCDHVVVVAKSDTQLPPLAGLGEVWVEAQEPRHPLAGIAHALRLATGRAVLALAVDLPLMDAATLRLVASTPSGGAAAVVPRVHGRLQPCCARYEARALAAGLDTFDPTGRATDIVAALGIVEIVAPDPAVFLNVNHPEDLLHAAALLRD